MKKFKKVLSIISSISLLNFNGLVFNSVGYAMHSTQSKSGSFNLKHNYTYDELVSLLNSLELFIEKSTSGKSISNLEKETLELEKRYLKSKGVKEKYLKKLNRTTLTNISQKIDMTDPMYLRYFEYIDAGGTGCCRTYAGFVHELLKRFGVESYVIFTCDSKDRNPHTAVMVKMPLCEDKLPWYVVPCAATLDIKYAMNILEYLIITSQCNHSKNIGEIEIQHQFGGTTTKSIEFIKPLTYDTIPYAGKAIIELLDNITNELKKNVKK